MNYTRNEFLKLTGLSAAGVMAVTTGSSFIKNPAASDFKFPSAWGLAPKSLHL